jgi:hypothetical protein
VATGSAAPFSMRRKGAAPFFKKQGKDSAAVFAVLYAFHQMSISSSRHKGVMLSDYCLDPLMVLGDFFLNGDDPRFLRQGSDDARRSSRHI